MILGTIPLRQRVCSDTLCTDDKHIVIPESGLNCIRSNSIDIRLGQYVKIACPKDRYEAYSYKIGNMEYKTIDILGTPLILLPKGFVLGMAFEWIRMPIDLTATVETRSSVGRFGLFAVNAGRIEPNWKGNLTLEIFNAENFSIELSYGMPIAQLVFAEVEGAVAYDEFQDSKYQGDTLPEPSKLYLKRNTGR